MVASIMKENGQLLRMILLTEKRFVDTWIKLSKITRSIKCSCFWLTMPNIIKGIWSESISISFVGKERTLSWYIFPDIAQI